MLGKEAEHWDQVAKGWSHKSYANEILAEHKRNTYLKLVSRWADIANSRTILKTDLFAEAFGPEQFIFDLTPANGIVGIDVSREIVIQAKSQARHHSVDSSKYLCCDVKRLPFRNNCFDLIISDSTLDHFPNENDIVIAIKELGRVLQVGGTLILTIDNKSNLTYPPFIFFRLWMKLKLAPYFIGRTLSRAKLQQTLNDSELDVVESTTIFHYPHPDGLIRWLERSIRNLGRGRFDNAIRKGLAFLDQLEGKKSKYLTGRYLALKAVKKQPRAH